MRNHFIFILLFVVSSNTGLAADIEGLWLTENGDAKVKTYQCADKICGDLVWLKEPNWSQEDVNNNKNAKLGLPKVDLKNDDENLKTRPLLGLTLLTSMKQSDDNEWGGGKIYDAESGNIYSCQATLVDSGHTLKMKGYIGVSWLGRTTTWTRVEQE